MSKSFSDISEKTNKIAERVRMSDSIMPFLIGAVLFVFIGAFSFMLSQLYKTNESTLRTEWSYAFVESADTEPAETDWRETGGALQLKKPENKYVRLSREFKAGDSDRILRIMTDYAPMRIYIDHIAVYDNRLDSADFVGNRYNAVKITAEQNHTVDIVMTVPFTTEFRAYTVIADENTNISFNLTAGMIFGAIITAIGVLALIVALILTIKNRKYAPFIGAPLIAIFTGIKLCIDKIGDITYLLNSPMWYSAKIIANIAFIAVLMLSIISVMRIKKSVSVLSVVYILLSAGLLLIPNALLLRLATAVVYIFGFVPAGMLLSELYIKLRQRLQYAPSCLSFSVYIIFIMLTSAIINIFTLKAGMSVLYTITLAVFTGFLCFINIQSLALFQKHYEKTTVCYEKWIEGFSDMVGEIYSSESISDLAISACNYFCNSLNETQAVLYGKECEDVKCCACFIGADGEEISLYSNSENKTLNFKRIIYNFGNGDDRIFLSDSYFDYIFCIDGEPRMLLHFENILPDAARFATSVSYIVYTVINVMFQRLCFGLDDSETLVLQQNEMRRAAVMAERENPGHIDNVIRYTRRLCEGCGIDGEAAEQIAIAASLHDIGKIALPNELLEKRGTLRGDERALINKHTMYGYMILSALPGYFMEMASQIALFHHSSFADMKDKNTDEKYFRYAQIVSVADVFDALKRKRNYKDPWEDKKILNYIDSLSGTKFDPDVVKVFDGLRDEFTGFMDGEV